MVKSNFKMPYTIKPPPEHHPSPNSNGQIRSSNYQTQKSETTTTPNGTIRFEG